MNRPNYWGVAGYPISHSLTPRLFEIVGGKLGFDDVKAVFLEVGSAEEFVEMASELEGDLWISCTSPLKRSVCKKLGIDVRGGLEAVNQVVRVNGDWSGSNTDGDGFVNACRHIGLDPEGKTLEMKGGGSTARSVAMSWAVNGGKIVPVKGRRELVHGIWGDSFVGDSNVPDLSVDMDRSPGTPVESGEVGRNVVSVTYGEDPSADEFGVLMVAAQHLEAWKSLFTPDREGEIPSLSDVLKEI